MDISINAKKVFGEVNVISSKSELHRLLILSSFAKDKSRIFYNGVPSLDVVATCNCLQKLNAKIEMSEGVINVEPIKNLPKEIVKINCGESGSTLRFMLPLLAVLGVSAEIEVSGRLKERPLSPMYELLTENGVTLSEKGKYPLKTTGKLDARKVKIDGSVSSQFISGLLMAFVAKGTGASVEVTGDFQSKSYVDITVGIIKKFDIDVTIENNKYVVNGKAYTGKTLTAYGDWSNGAFFLSLGAINKSISVKGLDINSFQGDKKIVNLLEKFGAVVRVKDNAVITKKESLTAMEIDVSDIPDLVPVLAVVAGLAKGKTIIYNGERLRLKESDRIKSVVAMINDIGGNAKERKDGMEIVGVKEYEGGVVDSFNDHRIVMASAVASSNCKREIIIKNATAVNKSYPNFFEEMKKLGCDIKEV